MSGVGRVMLARMYDTATSCQPAIAVFSVTASDHDVFAPSPTRLKALGDVTITDTDDARHSPEVNKASYHHERDISSPEVHSYSDSKRYSDDSTDARDDVDAAYDDEDDDGRRSPDSDVTRKDDDDMRRGGEKKVYRCQHCKYITDRKNNLKRHVITMHETCSKVLECCDVVFKNKASLRDHVLSCHKNGYDCRICGRTFCRKALLKRHITVHSGQKDYVCGVCGYATSHKSNLDRHKRRHGAKYHTNGTDHLSPTESAGEMSPGAPGGPLLPPPPPPGAPAGLPLPMKLFGENFWWNVLTDPIHQVASYPNPFTPSFKPCYPYKYYKSHKHKTYKSSLLTKRLLYTYQRSDQKDCNSDMRQASNVPMTHYNGATVHYNNGINGYHGNTAIKNDSKSPKKLPSSKKRLFPGLYRCHECGKIFDHQLELYGHHETAHTNCDVTDTPQCPLTRLSNVMTSPT